MNPRRQRSLAIVALALLLQGALLFSQTAQPAQASKSDRTEAILRKMTLEEKIDYIGGTGFAVRAMPKLGLPALEMSDGPVGVRSNAGLPSTVYAGGIGLAASWNPQLAARVGAGIGKDARARGIHFMLGPGVNIYRSPRNGRNFEYFGEDPFLAGAIATGYIMGMQEQGVSATVKHYLGNNAEWLRHDSDTEMDERTAREIYLPAFEAAVKRGHVGAIMDSYNLIDGQHATQNGYFNIDVARKEWNFPGVMMSDWVATYDGIAAANGGLDLEMPTGDFMNREHLLAAVKDGRVKETTIDEKVRHILNTAARFGWLDRAQVDPSLSVYSKPDGAVALDAARESIVLLKNDSHVLPLDKANTHSVLVVGPDGYPAVAVAGGSAKAIPFAPVSILQGLGTYLGASGTVYYDRGLPKFSDLARNTRFTTAAQNGEKGLTVETFASNDLSGAATAKRIIPHVNDAGKGWDDFNDVAEAFAAFTTPKPSSRRWTGYYTADETAPYEIALQCGGEGGGDRMFVDDKLVIDNWKISRALEPHVTMNLAAGPHKIVVEDWQGAELGGHLRVAIADQHKLVSENAKALASKVDAVVIAAGFDADSESEGSDRTFELPIGQDELIHEIAALNKKTIVTVISGGNVEATTWIDRVPAYLELWYPGQSGGTALAEALFGAMNPSGRLPATFERKLEDNPTFANYYAEGDKRRVIYREGVFVGYRGYERSGTKPLFPFGYGLSYTTFSYANLSVTPGGNADALYTVSFDVTNTGDREGADVAQLYIADGHAKIERPAKELKGFQKTNLKPRETQHVSIPLDARSFAYFDAAARRWSIAPGTFEVLLGRSSQEIVLKGTVNVQESVNKKL